MRRLNTGLLFGLVATLATLSTVCAFSPNKMLFGRPMHGFVLQHYTVEEVQKMIANGELPGMSTGFFKQTLNHKAKSTDADFGVTFDQRFYSNDEYYQAGGPEFLYIGGESPESGHAIVTAGGRILPIMKWAKDLNARAWVLEHRFYGQSRPFPVNETNYIRVCEDSYRSQTWGSNTCADAIKMAFKAVHELMDHRAGREYLDKAFSLYPPLSRQDLNATTINNFYSNLVGYFQGAVQYNRVNGGIYKDEAGIIEICDRMIHSDSYSMVSGLVNVMKYLSKVQDGVNFDKLFDSYQDAVNMLRDPNYYDEGYGASARSWTWQTCNEFGYFQTTDIGDNIFGDSVQNSFYINLCVDVFGAKYDYTYVKKQVKATLDKYGGRTNYDGKNVVAPNGKIDPWHALGLQREDNTDATVVKILIDDTAHCADMEPELTTDSDALKQARVTIYQNIRTWLGLAPARPKRSPNDIQEIEEHEDLGQKLMDSQPKVEEAREKVIENHPKLINRQKLPGTPLYTPEDFTQDLDHDHPGTLPFTQKLYRVTQFVKVPGPGPLILFPVLNDNIDDYIPDANAPIAVIAAQTNATILFVRCRFFGDSRPNTDLKMPNLNLLTLDQTIKDLQKIITDQTTPFSKVAVVGTAFGGTLAAHLRRLYPATVVGALASSAPMEFQFSYTDALKSLQDALIKYDQKCSVNLWAFYDSVYRKLNDREGRKTMIDAGVICPNAFPDADTVDPAQKTLLKARLMKRLFDAANAIGQDKAGVDFICSVVANEERTTATKARQLFPTECIDVDYANFLAPYKDDTNKANDLRVKTYLQCHEMGLFPNTDFGYNIFGYMISPNFHVNLCKDVFGFTHDDLHNNIAKARSIYGEGNKFGGTNVIFTHGTFDMYDAATFHGDSNGEDRVQLLIPNGGQSNDLLASVKTQEADFVRQQIITYFVRWLQN